MDQVLQDLIAALRGSGVRISTAETLDAMRATALLGCNDRKVLHDSLSVVLAKSLHEKKIFKTCFDRFFSLDGFSVPDTQPPVPPLLPSGKLDSSLTQMIVSGDNIALSIAMRAAAHNEKISEMTFFTQKSLYIQRILQGMGLEGLDRDIRRLSKGDNGATQKKATELKKGREFLFENVKDFVEQQFSMYASSVREEIMEKYLRDMKLSNLEQQDFHRMHAIVKKMVKPLNDICSRRRKKAKRGLLDLKKTLRDNIACQGLLFEPRWKAKKIDRSNMVVLCDVSRSVEMVARFMLLFLYSLHEEIAKIRPFIFCSNMVDVSPLFDEYEVGEALIRLQKGVGLGIALGRTDYGQAFRDFKANWLDIITSKTTVLILGDARNNHGNPETGILALIHKRAKRVIWLNPEPRTFWGTGDSEMKKYFPFCTISRECSSVNHLERVVGSILEKG